MRFFAPLFFALGVSAHGYLGQLTIDGKLYKGTGDGGSPSNTVIRPTKPYDVGPVKGASNTDLRCGLSPVQNAALVATAAAGADVDVLWVGQGGTNWIHEVGPVMAYMAECTGVPDCTTFDPANAKWFKVDQKGLKSDGSTWYMADIFNGKPVSFTIPSNLKAGNYLLRSELIALHNALSVGGAEFYPNCAQLKVTGSGTGVPSTTVSFPGAYSDTDPGIVVPDIYNPGFTYTFPGGPVATFGSGGSSSSSSSSSSSGDNEGSSSVAKTVASAKTKASSSTKIVASASTSAVLVEPTTSAEASLPEPTTTASAKTSKSTGVCANKNSNNRRRRSEARHRRAQAVRQHAASRAFHSSA